MKNLILVNVVLAALGIGATAQADGLAAKLKCTVTSVRGNLSSFLPPQVGDQITLDTAQPSLKDLHFTGHNQIPVANPLQAFRTASTPNYIAVFKADQMQTDLEKISLVVQVGKFFDGSKDVYQAEIQSILTIEYSGLVTVDSAKMDCQLAN